MRELIPNFRSHCAETRQSDFKGVCKLILRLKNAQNTEGVLFICQQNTLCLFLSKTYNYFYRIISNIHFERKNGFSFLIASLLTTRYYLCICNNES